MICFTFFAPVILFNLSSQENETQGMRLIVAPILAGEGVLNGLRGEYRRVEDKFMSMNMELKTAQVMFDLTTQHGNRTVCCLCIVSN